MGLLNKFRKTQHSKLEEVMESLSLLLSTKQSFGSWQKGMGLTDYPYAAQEEIVAKLMKDIRTNIERFETQIILKEIRLFSSYQRNLCFQIDCKLEEKLYSFYITFNSQGAKVEEDCPI